MKLDEVMNVNLKQLALKLQTALVDILEGFESQLEAVEADGKLISIKLLVEPAPSHFVRSFYKTTMAAKRSVTGKPHTIELYNGPIIHLGDGYSAIDGGLYTCMSPGIFLFKGHVRMRKATNAKTDLVDFVIGLAPEQVKVFVDEYVANWGQ